VHRLEHRRVDAEVGAGRQAQPAHQPGGQVGDDVAIEIGQHQHVERLRPLHLLRAQVVHDQVADADVRILIRDLARHGQEQAVRGLHDVRFVDGDHPPAAVAARVLEREPDHPLGAVARDQLDRDAHVLGEVQVGVPLHPLHQRIGDGRAVVELDAGVHVLGVLAYDHDIDVAVARRRTGIRLRRPHRRIQVQRLAQGHGHGAKARPHRCRHRPLERHARAPDRIEHALRQRRPLAFGHGRAGRLAIPADAHPGPVDHT
jgi:hypothetical protein